MGKSTTAAMMRRFGWPVFDSDAAARSLTAQGGAALPEIAVAFSGVVGPMGLDREALARAVFSKPEALARLEGILHPKIGATRRQFLMNAALLKAPVVVLDIPLLFETGGDRRADVIAVVTAPPDVQRQRVLSRGQMTEAEFEAILDRQAPDSVKRQRADFVINTGFGFPYAEAQVDEIIEALRTRLMAATEQDGTCGKSSSIPKPPASIPDRATAS